ncbi:MAG: thioredoxin family protein [Verrucomicrobiota bacterium]
MKRCHPWLLCFAVALASCKTGKVTQDEQPNPITPSGKPLIRSKNSDAGTPVTPGGDASGKPLPAGITPESDIVYTDPDRPEVGIPELATLLSAPKRGPWEESATIARQRSVREGKPLLIWFTDSQTSPMCKALSQELFATSEFGDWATEKLVRLKVDANIVVDDPDLTLLQKENRIYEIKHYALELKKRYKVMGYPALIMLNSSGEVIGHYRGYKRGNAEYLWGQLRHAEAVSVEANRAWRASLEKKGYREWQDRKERKVFAKLTSYSNGTLTLIEPDGTRSRTKESSLSDKDRGWIAEQKKIRKIQ